MHHPKIWENHCRRELLAQLEAKGKIYVPKRDANERYDKSFHRTAGRVLVPHDHDAMLAAQERLQQNTYKFKGSSERHSLQKRCHFVKKQIKDEKQAVSDLEKQRQHGKDAEQHKSAGQQK